MHTASRSSVEPESTPDHSLPSQRSASPPAPTAQTCEESAPQSASSSSRRASGCGAHAAPSQRRSWPWRQVAQPSLRPANQSAVAVQVSPDPPPDQRDPSQWKLASFLPTAHTSSGAEPPTAASISRVTAG